MKTVYYNIKNQQGKDKGATMFDEDVDFAKRIELSYLLESQGYTLTSITKEEYESSHIKIDAI